MKLNLKRQWAEAINSPVETCYCVICRQTSWVKETKQEPLTYALECGHTYTRNEQTKKWVLA